MNGELVAFFILALITLGGAVLMLNLQKVVHMVVVLAFTFLSIAGLFILLEAEFLAFAQVLIYGGSVTIIMLFGIMLTRHDGYEESGRKSQKWYAGIGVLAFFLLSLFAINGVNWLPQETALFDKNTAQIGTTLFTKYIIPFELVSLVLLVALVGAIILARRDEDDQVGAKEGENHE